MLGLAPEQGLDCLQSLAALLIGASRTDDEPTTPLLWVVRDTFKLKGSKFGCGAGLCGACTMHIDGEAERTCVLPVSAVAGKNITTIEGLGTPEDLHPLQAAWHAYSVPQCGYCQSGQIMSAAALLEKNPSPTTDDVDAAMATKGEHREQHRQREPLHKDRDRHRHELRKHHVELEQTHHPAVCQLLERIRLIRKMNVIAAR